MNTALLRHLGSLLSVQSIITLMLTAVFTVMALRNSISQDFMTVYAVVIAFYFSTRGGKSTEGAHGER